MHFSSRFKNHVKFVFKSIFIPLMWGSALWVCPSLEASWQSLGHCRQNLLYSELRNKTQKQRRRSIRLQLLAGNSKIFFLLVIVHSKVQFVFIVNTKRSRGKEKQILMRTSITRPALSLCI